MYWIEATEMYVLPRSTTEMYVLVEATEMYVLVEATEMYVLVDRGDRNVCTVEARNV